MRSAKDYPLGFDSARSGLSRVLYSLTVTLVVCLSLQGERAGAETKNRAPAAYKWAEVDTPPRQKEVRVYYPRSARREHAQITLRFVVTKEGKVDQLTVMKFTDPEMVDAAYQGYSSAEFYPGIKNGSAVDTWIEVTDTAK